MTNLEAAKIIDHLGIKQVYDDMVSATEICLSLDKGWCATSTDFGEALTLALSALESIDRITAERDAAVEDLKNVVADEECGINQCYYCKYREEDGQCHHECIPHTKMWGWEWRGVQND